MDSGDREVDSGPTFDNAVRPVAESSDSGSGGASALDSRELIDAVSRRADFMASLTDRPTDKSTLQEELGVSRSTVYKALRELEHLHVVERSGDDYRPTLLGRLLFEEYEQLRVNISSVRRAADLISVLPADCGVTTELLNGADTVVAQRHAPHQPVRVLEEMVTDATALKGMTPVVLPSYVDLFSDRLGADELRATLVIERPVIDALVDDYGEIVCQVLEAGNLRVYEIDEWLPFGLVVVEDPAPLVGVFVYNSRGEMRGLITNDSQESVDWGNATWETYRKRSTELRSNLVSDAPE